MTHRASLLPITEYCGLAGALHAKYGRSRAAVKGSYFHALCAGLPTDDFVLTEKELAEISSWKKPVTLVHDGRELDYSSATKELDLVWKGISMHPDAFWIVAGEWGNEIFVLDIKSNVGDPDSLQLMTYGLALSTMHGCVAFTPGIFTASDGIMNWGKTYSTSDFTAIERRVLAASTNESEYGTTGQHCTNCFQRLHCPEYMSDALSEGYQTIDGKNALHALLAADAMKIKSEALRARVQTWADDNNGIEQNGKVWKRCKGGAFRWCNAK